MNKVITNGFPIFIWPNEITNEKDINDLVLSDLQQTKTIKKLIDDNTYSDLSILNNNLIFGKRSR